MFCRILCIALLGPVAVVSAAVRLSPGVPLLVPAGTPASVRLAVDDLRRDLQKVFGAPSPIVEDPAALHGRSAIVVLGATGGPGEFHHPRIAGREAHGIYVRESRGAAHVVLAGADPRGTIYALYSFADEFLGVPPLWYWSGWQPQQRAAIEVPSATERIFPPAYVRWRAWFNNDTDFLSPWRERSPANDHAVYETVLRLKYNTYEIGSVADLRPGSPRFAVNRDAAGAHARGLVITHHHTSPLGSSLRDWEAYWRREGRALPPLSVRAPADLAAFWRYHAETARRAGFEQVWTIVFRGAGDVPFWQTFKDAPTDTAARAKIIGDLLHTQVAIVKEVTGDPAPDMRTTLYNEGSTMFAAGLLRPPAEPTLIWNFVAARRDHFPSDDVRNFKAPPDRLIGYYLNFQFTSSGSHLAAAEGPWKMAANYRIVDGTGGRPLAFTVVNAGNIREHLAELSANADMMWRLKEFSVDAFLRRFCARYFGPDVADEAAALYRDYYHAYWAQKPADIPGFDRQYLFQDMRYARAVEMLLKDLAGDVRRPNPLDGHPLDRPDTGGGYFRVTLQSGDADQTAALLRATAESGRKFSAVVAKADALWSRLAPSGRPFFDDNLRIRARLMVHLNAMLHETTLAYLAQPNREARDRRLKAALGFLDAARQALDATRTDLFAQWYDGDRAFGFAALREKLQRETSR